AGVCLAVALPGTLGRGILPMIYGCRVLDVSLWRYLLRALVPPIAAIALPAAGTQLLIWWHEPQNWLELFCYGGIFSFSYFIIFCVVVVGPEHLKDLLSQFKIIIRQIFGGQSEPAP
ncbi:MAG TPA: hypothetical protein VKK61_09030, partial [Tepidisphaeraceae bacterium]|nr:hypothetical protein [Tepidisphaeraceae bacterium]